MGKLTYFWSLSIVFIIPSLIMGYFVVPTIQLPLLTAFVISVTSMGGIYDVWATRHGPRDTVWLWSFSKKHTIGIRLFDVPIEEFLFYTFTSIYVVFVWESLSIAFQFGNLFFWLLPLAVGAWTCVSLIATKRFLPRSDKWV